MEPQNLNDNQPNLTSTEPNPDPIAGSGDQGQPQSFPPQPELQPQTQPQPEQQPPVGFPPSPVSSQASKNNKILKYVLIGAGALIVIILIIVLIMMLGNKKDSADRVYDRSDDSSIVDEDSDLDDGDLKSSEDVESGDKVNSADTTRHSITVNQSVVDSDLGITIEIRNVEVAAIPSDDNSKVSVLVEYVISNNGNYLGAPRPSSINLVDANGRKSYDSTYDNEDAMQAAGFTPWQSSQSALPGKSATGYAAYFVDKDAMSSLTASYKRLQTKLSDTGETLPAKEFTIEIQ